MPNYILTAYDHPNVLEKRLAVREDHFAYMDKLSKEGKVVVGGAMLSPEGEMIGSTLFLTMSEKELEEYQQNEPYIKAGVWGEIKIQEAKFADMLIANLADRYNSQGIV